MPSAVRQLALVAVLLLGACSAPDLVSRAPTSIIVSPSSLPNGVVGPRPLIAQATHLGSIVLRVDSVAALLTTMSEFTKDSGGSGPSLSPSQPIWVVAIRGDIRIDSVVDAPHAQCALFAYDAATGEVRASRSGPAVICDPYFK